MVKLGENIEKTKNSNGIRPTDGDDFFREIISGIHCCLFNVYNLLMRGFFIAGSEWSPPAKMARAGGKLSYNPQKKIGRGAISIIFEGLLEEDNGERRIVAVKRFQTSDIDDVVVLREVELRMRFRDHENILRCLHTVTTDNFV